MSETNGPGRATPEQIAKALAEYTTLKTESRRTAGKISTVLKMFEKDGGSSRALKALHDSLNLDKDEAAADLRERVRYLALYDRAGIFTKATQASLDLGVELGASVKTATGDAGAGLARARAHADGYNSGNLGASVEDDVFVPGTPEFVAWRNGHADGASDRAERLGEVAPAPTRRGKGRGAGAAA